METLDMLPKPYECVNPLKSGLSNDEFSLAPPSPHSNLFDSVRKGKVMNNVLPARPAELHVDTADLLFNIFWVSI